MGSALRSRWVISGALLVGAVLVLTRMGPWLLNDRASVEASPSLGPFVVVEDIVLRPGATACTEPAVVSPRVRTLEWASSSPVGQPLLATVRGQGFIARTTVAAESFGGGSPAVRANIPSGPERTVMARICLQNRGSRSISLIGNSDPLGDTPATSTVDDTPVPDLQLTLYGESRSFAAAIPDVVSRISELSAFPRWLVWALVVALVFAVPGLSVSALVSTQRSNERSSGGSAPDSSTPEA